MRAFSMQPTRAAAAAFATCLTMSFVACEPETPSGGGDAGSTTLPVGAACASSEECIGDAVCQAGVCALPADAGPADAGPAADAGPEPAAELVVEPDGALEFGAQQLGVPVEREVFLRNVGDDDMDIVAFVLDADSDEFAITPSGTVNHPLAPGENLRVVVSHTPADGLPDEAELQVLHTGPGNLATIELFAEFKGDAALKVRPDLDADQDSVTMHDFGEVVPGTMATAALYVRNTGARDSVLTVTDVTLTPPTAGFALASEPTVPQPLGAASTVACTDVSTCPTGAAACTDEVCRDDAGLPLAAVTLPIVFTPDTVSTQATVTIEVDIAGSQTQHDVLLTGRPTQPAVRVAPESVDFGQLIMGSDTVTTTVAVHNDGLGPLVVSQLTPPTDATYAVGTPGIILPATVQPGGAPLNVQVQFTPSDEGTHSANFILDTNDASRPQVVVPLAAESIACESLCEARPNTAVTCGADFSCQYDCAAAHFDLNGDLNVAQGSTSNGCEYACAGDPSDDESCNQVDDNCDGRVDEGLEPDFYDTWVPPSGTPGNSTCETATPLQPVSTGGSRNFLGSLYQTDASGAPITDNDWYAIQLLESESDLLGEDEEGNELCLVCGKCETYETTIALVGVPPGLEYELDVMQGCGATETWTVTSGQGLVLNWDVCPIENDVLCLILWATGTVTENMGCGTNDTFDLRFRVRPAASNPDAQSCSTYEFVVDHAATGQHSP